MTQEDKAKAYDEALGWMREMYPCLTDSLREDAEHYFPELAESEDERIREELKEAFEAYDIESSWNGIPIRSIFAWLEKQKENPKSADSIPSDCTAGAKCEDRWHKVKDSLPDNSREVLCKDAIGNFFIGRYYRKSQCWEVMMYDDCDKSNEDNPPVVEWCEIPSENQKEQNGEDEECTDFTIYHPLKNGKGEYECIPYSFYGPLTSFSEDKDLIDFLRTCFYTEEECNEWIKQQQEQKPVRTAKQVWKEMRLEVYAQASGNRHEPNCSDNSTKMFSLYDIDEIFEKIGDSTVGPQKPIECIEFDNEFEKQVSHLLASVLNGEWEYNEGFVKHVAQSLLGYAKNELEQELPLMGGDTDAYFDDLRITTKPLTSREWFDEGIKYAQRLQKEQKHNYCLYGGYPNVGRCRWCSAACSARLADVHTDEEKEYIRTIKSIISDFIRDKKPENLAYYQRIYDWLDGRHVPFSCGHENGKPAEWVLPEDFEEAVYKVANFISPFDNQEELRKTSHHFAEQLLSLAKKELDKTPDPVFSKQEYESYPIISEDTTSAKPAELDGKALLYTADKSYQIGFRDGVASVKPAEWSEEDEKRIQRICGFLWKNRKGDTDTIYQIEKDADWLKSLRPSWKPSEEQMDSLCDTIANTKGYSYSIYLPELYEQLKKLV